MSIEKKFAKEKQRKQKLLEKEYKLTLCQKIKEQRENLEMTQSELAEKLDMKQSQISNIEKGLANIDLYKLKKIIEFLRFNPYDFFELRSSAILKNGRLKNYLTEILPQLDIDEDSRSFKRFKKIIEAIAYEYFKSTV